MGYALVECGTADATSWIPWGDNRHAPGTIGLPGLLATLSLAAVGLVALGRHPRRARFLLGVAILGLLPQLAACDLDFDFWGTVNGKYTFHKLTYVPENFEPILDQRELWRLTEGEGTMDLDLTLKMSMEEEAEQSACQVTNSVKTDLLVLAKGAITPAELGD